MTSIQYKGLPSNRISNSSGVNTADLECSICHELLWKPVACQTCETPYCLTCIEQWLQNNSKCPSGCKVYTERKCPPFVAKLLAHLQVSCFYQPNGCQQVLSYEGLDKHEAECGYQPEQCRACKANILKKDIVNHKRNCVRRRSPTQERKSVYNQNRGRSSVRNSGYNTDNGGGYTNGHNGGYSNGHSGGYSNNIPNRRRPDTTLRDQFRQLQEEFDNIKQKIQMLTEQLKDMHGGKKSVNEERIITFSDLPSAAEETKWVPDAYQGFIWTKLVYMERSYASETYPKSGYISAFMPDGSSHIAFFNEEATISSENSNETFTLVSLSACAAWNDNLHLTICGYRNSVQIHTHTSILLFGKPQVIVLLWKNIDKIVLQPSGGALHSENKDLESDTHCVLTQLTIN